MLQKYINQNYNGQSDWFIEEANQMYHKKRTSQIIDLKEYLSGQHSILSKPSYMFNGEVYNPKKIVLQLAKTMVNFTTTYLLSNPITLTGDEEVTKAYNSVYRRGRYDSIDFDILDSMVKYGLAIEYIYLDGKTIKSKLFDPADCIPVFDHRNNYIAMIEHYCINNIDYYTVYSVDKVEEWTNEGGNLSLIGEFKNITGLPIIYRNKSETDNLGRSDLLDMIPIIDSLEQLVSKTFDAYDHYLTGIPVITGQQLKGDGLPKDIVSAGLVLEHGSEFDFKSNEFDHAGFESIYKTLSGALLDIANVPAVSMNNKAEISNISEVSIKLLFSLSDLKANLNEKYMREGIDQRFDVIRKLLELQGKVFTDDQYETLEYHFHYARPASSSEIVDNLKILRESGLISVQTGVEKNPYVNDVVTEMDRIEKGSKNEKTEDNER